ncbi:MAG: phospholipase D-like domain-containing protein [Sorangiineae bacterium]|nr:phospholipase D-like domain-containing protein [Polyangiaceae bacterium]MEB2324415.1 phospholipase D-like domain-containing protein [Sorangiineae bacterium]
MLVTLLTIAEVVYVVVLAIWILFEKRPPVSTIAWILALIALPYLGFFIYFFLGRRRLERKRLRYRRARGADHGAPGDDAIAPAPRPAGAEREDPRVGDLDRLAMNSGEPPSTFADEVEVFHDAASTYDAIEAAIRAARHHVHVAYYIFDSGRVGTRFIDLLIERAQAGVKVRLLIDDVGSSGMKRDAVRRLEAAQITVTRFNPVSFSRLRSRFDFRNHRKIVVCDGRVGFTGGINLCDDYLPELDDEVPLGGAPARARRARARHGHPSPWRDTHVKLVGDAVRWLQLTFLCDYHYASGMLAREPEVFPPFTGAGRHRVQVVTSGPDREIRAIQDAYFAAMALARERVWVTTPYFIPDQAMRVALTTAARRGVDVRILVPRRSDSLVVTAAARSYFDAILATGVKIYEYTPTMIHSKTLVVDDFFAAVGTANLDIRSFRLNFEITAILYGETHARELARAFERDLASAVEVTPQTRAHLGLAWRAAEAGARVLSPLL